MKYIKKATATQNKIMCIKFNSTSLSPSNMDFIFLEVSNFFSFTSFFTKGDANTIKDVITDEKNKLRKKDVQYPISLFPPFKPMK